MLLWDDLELAASAGAVDPVGEVATRMLMGVGA